MNRKESERQREKEFDDLNIEVEGIILFGGILLCTIGILTLAATVLSFLVWVIK